MNNKILLGIIAAMLLSVGTVMATDSNTCTIYKNTYQRGFDQYGYNRCANQFVGTGNSWCAEHGYGSGCLGIYSPDNLVIKWNDEWDRGNAENWASPPYDAWLNNEDNGMVPGGSGTTEHVKIIWVGPTLEKSLYWRAGGYAIGDQWEVIQDFYGPGTPDVLAHAIPNGYGA